MSRTVWRAVPGDKSRISRYLPCNKPRWSRGPPPPVPPYWTRKGCWDDRCCCWEHQGRSQGRWEVTRVRVVYQLPGWNRTLTVKYNVSLLLFTWGEHVFIVVIYMRWTCFYCCYLHEMNMFLLLLFTWDEHVFIVVIYMRWTSNGDFGGAEVPGPQHGPWKSLRLKVWLICGLIFK